MAAMRVTLSILLVICSVVAVADAQQLWANWNWQSQAHCTFYGGTDASGTMGGSCGYGNLYSTGYGTSTAALSNALFNNGLSCGACFQIQCITSQSTWCYPGASIIVTATNQCPPGSYGGWCDPPNVHFDLAYPMFTTLANPNGGVIPVQFRRVVCSKKGGVNFSINGNPWFILTLITNVGGGGDVSGVTIRGNGNWIQNSQNWGVNWECSGHSELVGKALSYQITQGSGWWKEFDNVAYSNWGFSQTFSNGQNFS